jgi:hypothetical protein
MTKVSKRSIRTAIIFGYIGLIAGSYLYEVDSALFFLTLPWSGLVAIFGMMLIHMFSSDLNSYLLAGAAINVLLLLRLSFFGNPKEQTCEDVSASNEQEEI